MTLWTRLHTWPSSVRLCGLSRSRTRPTEHLHSLRAPRSAPQPSRRPQCTGSTTTHGARLADESGGPLGQCELRREPPLADDTPRGRPRQRFGRVDATRSTQTLTRTEIAILLRLSSSATRLTSACLCHGAEVVPTHLHSLLRPTKPRLLELRMKLGPPGGVLVLGAHEESVSQRIIVAAQLMARTASAPSTDGLDFFSPTVECSRFHPKCWRRDCLYDDAQCCLVTHMKVAASHAITTAYCTSRSFRVTDARAPQRQCANETEKAFSLPTT